MRDERKEARHEVNHEFESIEEFITEYVANVSRSGVFIKTEDPLPVGTSVRLRFSVIVEDVETIEGEGEVVRVSSPADPGPTGMGVVFTSLSDYSRALIERLMTQGR